MRKSVAHLHILLAEKCYELENKSLHFQFNVFKKVKVSKVFYRIFTFEMFHLRGNQYNNLF